MMLVLLLALSHKILALDASCYIPELVPRIVGGTEADKREFPFLAHVRTATSLCGGSLIAPTWVLTAAHCGESLYVVMGKHYLDGNGDKCEERINVKRRIPHPQYNAALHSNDIMLLELETPSTYRPIRLWNGVGNAGAVGSYNNVAGWGTESESSQTAAQQLMKVAVPIQSNADCAKQYGSVINSDMLCAGETSGGRDSCTGDSGGPLFLRDVSNPGGYLQTALVSFGMGCAQADSFGVYTRISSFLGWICTNSGVCGAQVPTPVPPTFRPVAPTRFPTPPPTRFPTPPPSFPTPPPSFPTPPPTSPTPPPSFPTPPPTSPTPPPTFRASPSSPPSFAPAPSAPPSFTPPTFAASAPTNGQTSGKGKNCRTCVWCFSSLPICPPATKPPTVAPPTPLPTLRPTTQPTAQGKGKGKAAGVNSNNNNGLGNLFGGGNLGNLLGLQLLLGGNRPQDTSNGNYNDYDNSYGTNDQYQQQSQYQPQQPQYQPQQPQYQPQQPQYQPQYPQQQQQQPQYQQQQQSQQQPVAQYLPQQPAYPWG